MKKFIITIGFVIAFGVLSYFVFGQSIQKATPSRVAPTFLVKTHDVPQADSAGDVLAQKWCMDHPNECKG